MYLPPVPRRDLRQLDEVLGRVERVRRVDERGADPERPRLHLAPHELAHGVELGRGGPTVVEADHVLADRAGADERGDVRGDPAPLQEAQVIGERRPRDVEPEVPLHRPAAELHGLAPGAVGLALPEDLGRHALADVALRAGVGEEVVRGPREHVDEAGGDGEAGRVDHRAASGAGEIADRLDAVAAQAEVGPAWRAARAVVDGAALDQHVERGRLQRRRREGGQKEAGGDRGGSSHGASAARGSRGREC